nr:unnamed protein product [Digitaria exilis]
MAATITTSVSTDLTVAALVVADRAAVAPCCAARCAHDVALPAAPSCSDLFTASAHGTAAAITAELASARLASLASRGRPMHAPEGSRERGGHKSLCAGVTCQCARA